MRLYHELRVTQNQGFQGGLPSYGKGLPVHPALLGGTQGTLQAVVFTWAVLSRFPVWYTYIISSNTPNWTEKLCLVLIDVELGFGNPTCFDSFLTT